MDKDEKDDKEDTLKSSPKDLAKEAERKSSRQRAILIAKEEKEDLPIENIDWETITPDERVRMKDRFFKKEAELLDLVQELTHSNAICCLGRDRTFRRYWIFQSVPGLFVEDDEDQIPDDLFQPIEQTGSSNPLLHDDGMDKKVILGDEKCASSDKENESFEGSTEKKSNSSNDAVNGGMMKETNVDVSEEPGMQFESVHHQIENRTQVRWAYFNTPEQVDKLVNSLNPRGYREGPLKQTIIEHKQQMTNLLEQCPIRVLSLPKSEGDGCKENQAVSVKVKSRNKTTQGTVQNGSAQEFLELNLRESLLDIEERIFVGTLGAMKVHNRAMWRHAIENGSFDQQSGTLTWSGKAEDHMSPSKYKIM